MDCVKFLLHDTSRKYWSKVELDVSFSSGYGSSSISSRNLNSLPTATTHRGISVLSIGAVFHAYWDALICIAKVSFVALFVPHMCKLGE